MTRRKLSPRRRRVCQLGLGLIVLGALVLTWQSFIGIGFIIIGSILVVIGCACAGVIDDTLDKDNKANLSVGTKQLKHLPLDEQLRRLYQLRDDAIITEEEYTARKRQILERM